jgi:hypothetical protein
LITFWIHKGLVPKQNLTGTGDFFSHEFLFAFIFWFRVSKARSGRDDLIYGLFPWLSGCSSQNNIKTMVNVQHTSSSGYRRTIFHQR